MRKAMHEDLKYSSPLTTCYKKALYCYDRKNTPIDTITIHCTVGQGDAQHFCDYFANIDRVASCNYCVGNDGSIGVCVPEELKSACTSNSANDRRAVTIEVSSDTTSPYAVTDEAFAGLLNLVTDICKRNKIRRLVWSEEKDDRVNHKNGCNMTVHRDYANKSCPGDYLYERHGLIASEVNRRLSPEIVSPLNITSLTATSFQAIFKANNTEIDSDAALWKFYYNIYKIDKSKETPLVKANQITPKEGVFTINSPTTLIPNTSYRIDVIMEDIEDEENSTTVLSRQLTTSQDYPKPVQDVKLSLPNNYIEAEKMLIKFSPTKSWGYWSKNTRGYRLNLIINGNTVLSNDTLIQHGYLGVSKITINISTLLAGSDLVLLPNTCVQVGIQPWVTDDDKNFVLDSNNMCCSNSIFIRHIRPEIDKFLLKLDNKYKHTIIYLGNATKEVLKSEKKIQLASVLDNIFK